MDTTIPSLKALEVTHKDQIADLSFDTLPFSPMKLNGKNLSFREVNKQGVFVVKEAANNRITVLGGSSSCLYHQLRLAAMRYHLNGIHSLSVITCDKSLVEPIQKRIRITHRRVPLFKVSYNDFLDAIRFDLPIDVDVLNFVPVYKTPEQLRKGTKSTLKSAIQDFKERRGIYLFKEDGVIVYVGKASTNLFRIIYGHMLPSYDKEGRRHHRASYYETRGKCFYEVAVIELLSTKELNMTVAQALRKLEVKLVRQLNPRDNRHYKSIIPHVEGDAWSEIDDPPVLIFNANDIPEADLPEAPF